MNHWRRGVMVSSVVLINEVHQHLARLVLEWVVAAFGPVNHPYVGLCNKPTRSTQPSMLPGSVK